MSLRGFSASTGKTGANAVNDGREFALIANGVAVGTTVELGKTYKFLRIEDAEALGITAVYDVDNSVQVHRHISEFFRIAGEGKILHVIIIAQTVLPIDMIPFAKTVIVATGGKISDFVFSFNPADDYVDTLVDGLNEDVLDAIPALQGLAVWADANDRPLHTILEGRAISETLSSLCDLRALLVGGTPAIPAIPAHDEVPEVPEVPAVPGVLLNATKVTLVVGQDWSYADGLHALGKKFADVGTFLGCVAGQAWNQNPGEVATLNLQDALTSKFLVGGLSNHKTYAQVMESLETMNTKGYVFPIEYVGTPGYWWNDGHCCCEIINDVEGNMNEHMIYFSHTVDMAKRALRIAYMPEVKKTKPLENGKLPAGLVGYYDAIGDDVFGKMQGKQLISGGKTTVDPNSDLLIAKLLKLAFKVGPTGCIGEIKGTINLTSN